MPHAYLPGVSQHLKPLQLAPRPLQWNETPGVVELFSEVLGAWALVFKLISAPPRGRGAHRPDALSTRNQGEREPQRQ